MNHSPFLTAALFLCCLLPAPILGAEPVANPALDQVTSRTPKTVVELDEWLKNMVWYHQYTPEEIIQATGLPTEEIEAKLVALKINAETKPALPENQLLMLPYPGGRHPRIGFLEGAIDPVRETKISLFTPWDPDSYVVMDLPEALWSNLGLTYLAHVHVPTIWSKENIELEAQEWTRAEDGSLLMSRTLPNGIRYDATARVNKAKNPNQRAMLMTLSLTNGTDSPLKDLRVQNCVMLKGAPEFAQQSNENKQFRNPFVVCKSSVGNRYIITAWERCVRPWGNNRCPCLHSDPQFPNLAPGESATLKGWLSFYEGEDVEGEMKRIEDEYFTVE
ncbi:hypothetical protein Pla110_45010 [Polystyrenella longa]|uniref:Uncharacterized protein n=1 Tax=Polystyrenella longa TaxID=2528007 RepID=A0A518CU31_9PLAN|nr:hypothetical protein [Polystyrenella longa]QDU82739.1 hypothetical protein Pla110_45010 [Polystyrenella longa]